MDVPEREHQIELLEKIGDYLDELIDMNERFEVGNFELAERLRQVLYKVDEIKCDYGLHHYEYKE